MTANPGQANVRGVGRGWVFVLGTVVAILGIGCFALMRGPQDFVLLLQAGGGLGGAIGPFLGGWLFDVTGSYRLAFLAACVAVAGSAVAAWFGARPMASAPDPQP